METEQLMLQLKTLEANIYNFVVSNIA